MGNRNVDIWRGRMMQRAREETPEVVDAEAKRWEGQVALRNF